MHNAPSVSFPVGRSRFQGRLIGVLVGFGALTELTWSVQANSLDWRQWLGAGMCVTILAWSGRTWWRTPSGSLSWEGVAWYWAAGARSLVVMPQVVLDLQVALLLRLPRTADTGVTWLWLDRSSNPSRWMALRRAIYSHARRSDDPLMRSANSSSVGAAP